MVDYDATRLKLQECNLRYNQLEARETCLRRLSNALSFQIILMKSDEIGISLRPKPLCL